MKQRNLRIKDKLRNKRIARKRAPDERPFSVVKRTFHGERTKEKTNKHVKKIKIK